MHAGVHGVKLNNTVMPKRKKRVDFLQMVAEQSDPESDKMLLEITGMTASELVQQVKEDYAAGRSRHQPWRWDQCHSWLEAWLYVYRRVRLDYHQHMFWEGERVRCVVWSGVDFNDKVLPLLDRFRRRFGVHSDLEELRLISTRVTPGGVERLRKLFPNAEVTSYSRDDEKNHPRLSFADPAEGARSRGRTEGP